MAAAWNVSDKINIDALGRVEKAVNRFSKTSTVLAIAMIVLVITQILLTFWDAPSFSEKRIRKNCYKEAMDLKNPIDPNATYRSCLAEHGIKPEDLFGKISENHTNESHINKK